MLPSDPVTGKLFPPVVIITLSPYILLLSSVTTPLIMLSSTIKSVTCLLYKILTLALAKLFFNNSIKSSALSLLVYTLL